MLVAAGTLAVWPQIALGGVFQCGPELRIAVLAALTGPFAAVQGNYYKGVMQAVDAGRMRGCAATVVARDAPSVERQLQQTIAAERVDRASVIIAPFGAAIASLAAEKVPSALVLDIMQASPFKSRPANLVALPYADLFFTADPKRADESLLTLGRVAAAILLETIQASGPGPISSPGALIEAMAGRRFESPGGTLVLDRSTGAFRRVR